MFTLTDVYEAAGQEPPFDVEKVQIEAAHYDSRRVSEGMLFVALPGIREDGNDYISSAFEAGAAAALCTRADASSPKDRQVVTPSPLQAFQRLAARLRGRSSASFVAVTGSNGKTTTKQALASALGAAGPTLATERSENTDVGIPATLSRLHTKHQYAVLEMGAQTVGEIAGYCKFAQPNISVITNIGTAHLGLFGSVDAVAHAKSEVLAALPPGAPAVLYSEDSWTPWLREHARGPVTTFGRGREADVQVSGFFLQKRVGTRVEMCIGNQKFTVEVPDIVGPIDLGFGAALATAVALDVDPEVAAKGLGNFEQAPHRMCALELPGGSRLLDDTYNANRASIVAALQTLRTMPRARRRIAVLGDMFELGQFAPDEHRAAGRAASDVDQLICVGALAQYFREGAVAAGLPATRVQLIAAETESTESIHAACQQVASLLADSILPGDLVLLKASNSMKFAWIVDALTTSSGSR